MVPLRVDPYSDEFQQNPFPAYATLRATAPVYQVPDHGFYLITTHALIRDDAAGRAVAARRPVF